MRLRYRILVGLALILTLVLPGCGLTSSAELFRQDLVAQGFVDATVTQETESETTTVRKIVNGKTTSVPTTINHQVLEGMATLPGFNRCKVELERDTSSNEDYQLDEVQERNSTEHDVELAVNRPTPAQVAEFIRNDKALNESCRTL